MSATREEITGVLATLLSTELDNLADGAAVLSSVIAGTGVYNNIAGNAPDATHGDGYFGGYLKFTPGGAFAARPGSPLRNASNNTVGWAAGYIDIWLIKSLDGGATFQSGSAAFPPVDDRFPDAFLVFGTVGAATPAAELAASYSTAPADNSPTRWLPLPGLKFKVLLRNRTGQAIPPGSTLALLPATDRAA